MVTGSQEKRDRSLLGHNASEKTVEQHDGKNSQPRRVYSYKRKQQTSIKES